MFGAGGHHMRISLIRVLGIIVVASPAVAIAGGPVNNPPNASGATSFNWQKEWGSVHMNSFADGLNDPGAPATATGAVPCNNSAGQGATTSICSTVSPDPSQSMRVALTNGIKYDIKNSLNNCMAKAVPNWSLGNNWDSDINTYGPCTNAPAPVSSLSNLNDANGTKFFHDYTGPETKWRQTQKDLAMSVRGNVGRKILTYLPIYDARSNDARAWGTGGPGAFVGCQQQITNNCGVGNKGEIIRDIHQCVSSPAAGTIAPTPGYQNPVSHVFTPQEVADLGGAGAQLPTIYYAYDSKDSDGNVRKALCANDPNVDPTKCTAPLASGATVEKIDTTDPTNTADHFLSNLKSYRFKVTEGDVQTFVVMDPKDFFDVRLYATGGTYDAAYEKQPSSITKADGTTVILPTMVDPDGNVETFNTCPVLGPTNGYGGICDPTGKAGCNLPIYGQGNDTAFTDAQGNQYTYANYPLKWSGYAKSWAVISQSQYLQNICGPKGCSSTNRDPNDREDYYIVDQDEGLTQNPVLMITRSTDYCEVAEMTSNPRQQLASGARLVADMPCVQYLQYQEWQDENGVSQWSFVDLYNPLEASYDTIPPENDIVQLFHLKANGDPDYTRPVAGTGPNRFIASKNSGTGNNFVRMLDAVDPEGDGTSPYVDATGVAAKVATFVDEKGSSHPAVSQNKKVVYSAIPSITGDPVPTMGNYLLCQNGSPFNPNDPNCAADTTKGTALYLKPGTATAMRMPQKVAIMIPDAKGKLVTKQSSCVVLAFTPSPDPATGLITSRDILVPTNTQEEFQSFVTAMNSANPPVEGAKLFDCSASFQGKAETKIQLAHEGQSDPNNFTDTWKDYSDPLNPVAKATFKTWSGTLQCPDVARRPACNQVKMISAQRRCQLENGALGSCDDCAALVKQGQITDPDAPSVKKFDFSDALVGGSVESSPMAQRSNSCYFSATCFAQSSDGCPPAGVPGGHVFCLSPETKIDMADGKQKMIKDIKAGDEVVAFNAKGIRSSAMSKAKVKATAVTKDQAIIQINGLKITPLHKVVLASGRAVLAKEVKVGDKLLKGNGQVELVTKVKTKNKRIKVYNLVLDKENDGYVAGGIRVMSYPLMPEMEVIEGHASVPAPKAGAKRGVSSLKRAQ